MITTRSTPIESEVVANSPNQPPPKKRVPAWKRRTASLSRWLHVYLSMTSFAILFFFAATGLTLNHVEWFEDQVSTQEYHGQINQEWLHPANSPDDVSRLEIVEYLRSQNGVKGAMSEFQVDDYQCTVSFAGPGYTADAFIDRDTGQYDLTETRMGMFAVMNDLHKGRDTGGAWSWVIDVSAVLMCLVSLTGLVLIFFLKKTRLTGLVAAAVGLVAAYMIYVIWVP